MKLIWTKSKLPLSVFIRWGLSEPVSHFAIVFDDVLVFQSNLLGVGLAWYPEFVKHATVVYEIDFPNKGLQREYQVYQGVITQYADDAYDYRAFFYFIWRAILFRLFKTPMPTKGNGATGSELCTELANALPDWVFPNSIRNNVDLSITSPYQLYLRLTESERGKVE